MGNADTVGEWLPMLAGIVYIGAPYLAVRTENTSLTTGPFTFFSWFLAGYIGPLLVAFYIGPRVGAPPVVGLAALAVAAVTVFVTFRHFVRRARGAGYGRNFAYLAVIPLVTIGCAMFLTTAPTVQRDDTE